MPSLVQWGAVAGEGDDEEGAEIFTSVDPLVHDQQSRFCGRKCLLLLLGVVGLTSALFLAIVFLVNTDLTVKDNDFASFLPQCSPIDTNQLWKSDTQKAVVVGLGRGVWTDQRNMEIVAKKSTCRDPPPFGSCREGMVAVDLGENEKVLICGGNECGYGEPRKECWYLRNGTTQSWRSEEYLGLTEGRKGASAILTDQGWWVTGGLVSNKSEASNSSGSLPTVATELLELPVDYQGNFTEGPDLPFAMHKHCILQIAPGLTLLIGGIAPTSPPATLATTLLYNWTSQSWCRMGQLASPRADLSCALLINSAEVLVFGGAVSSANNRGELLSLVSQTWGPGPPLPEDLGDLPLFSSHLTGRPEEKVLLAGVGEDSSQVFSFNPAKGVWQQEDGLKQGRRDALFFSVHKERLLCE